VIPAIGPEEFRVIENLPINGGIYPGLAGNDRFENRFLTQTEPRKLIVNDGVDGDGRLGQPVGQRLLLRSQAVEAVSLNLQECGGIDAVNQRRRGLAETGAKQKNNKRVFGDHY